MSILNFARSAIREKLKEFRRSPSWARVRDEFLENHPSCAACGGVKNLQVHHIKPFHLFPELELVESNLITLCMGRHDCHLGIGHGDNWKCYNPNVKKDAAAFATAPSKKKVLFESAKNSRLSQ